MKYIRKYGLTLDARGRVDGKTILSDSSKGTSFGIIDGIMLHVNRTFVGILFLDKSYNQFYNVVSHYIKRDEYGDWLYICLGVPEDDD